MSVSRFTKGLSTDLPSEPLAQFGMPDPAKYATLFEDFTDNMSFPLATSGLAAASNGTWTITVTEAGAGNASSAVADLDGGAITLTTDAADNDLIFVQHKNAAFQPVAGKKAFCKVKFSITDSNANASSILNTEWYCGLMVRDTDPLSSTGGDGVTDGIFFLSEDDTQDIYLYCQKNTTTGQTSAKLTDTLIVNTMTEFAWYWDGVRYLNYYVNGTQKGSIDLTTAPDAYLPDTVCCVSFGVKNGEAVAKVLTLDYIFVAKER